MENIQDIFKIALATFILVAVIGFFMRVANYIGEKLGFSRFFKYLWQKIKGV